MSATATNYSKIQACFESNKHFAAAKWLLDFRAQQLKHFMQNGLPTRKEELWKYTEIKEDVIPAHAGLIRETQLPAKITKSAALSPITLVFVNGHFAEKLSNIKKLPQEVTLCTLQQALEAHEDKVKPFLLREFAVKKFPFAVLNSALITNGIFLEIPPNIQVKNPIQLLFINTRQNDFLTNPRNLILANKHSQATIMEEHVSESAERYFTNTVTQIYAAENARVNYYKIQDDHLTARHVANVFIEQQQNSNVKTYCFSKGGCLEREDVSAWQHAPGAETFMHGLYDLRHDKQHVDHHVHIDHLAAHGTSSMIYKGILNKKSRAVFNGKVYVHPQTKQINAHQANHNLLLSRDAEVNTKPELEIYAEDVKCTHGATIGQLDQEPLFYLQSRGIEKAEAHKILTRAFAEEIYSQIVDTEIREYIRERMSDHDE